jgi:hypothetical protein
MAMQINKAAFAPAPPKKQAKKDKDFLAFIHQLPCCVTGRMPVEAAHLSFSSPQHGHWGRGRGTKVSDRWCLPLHASVHREGKDSQHGSNERAWWARQGIDPHALSLAIYGLWQEMGDDAVDAAIRVINEHRRNAKPA